MAESPITARTQDFASWYQDVVLQGDMAEPAEIVKGCMVIKANGYAVWELLQRELDDRFKATGHQNMYFPLLIPQSFMHKEAEHVEGFSPELAVVTMAGGKQLEEPYVIRPTSETIIGHFFAKWIKSWRDLPMLVNQWANIIRWELRTRMFLRTTEFLWQEGHTAHSTHEEAAQEVFRMLDVYAEVAEDVMAMPVIKGLKTQSEKFAGALQTYSIEAMMQNGFALQSGTSHDLGQNFGKAFNVQFQSKEGQLDYVWQTSWGVSTRLVGGLIMSHSDDKGLVLPPKVAPIKAVLVPIYKKKTKVSMKVDPNPSTVGQPVTISGTVMVLPDEEQDEKARVLEVAHRIAKEVDAKVDDREDITPGAKFFHWERRGVPVVLELGPRDLASGSIVLKRRDTGVKEVIPQSEVAAKLPAVLAAMQQSMYDVGKQRLKANTVLANSIEEVESLLKDVTAEKGGGKFVMAHLKDDPRCDARIKEFKATIRCIPLVDEYDGPGKCLVTGEPVDRRVVIAKAY
jgi:prolyl-tRNA synthetase